MRLKRARNSCSGTCCRSHVLQPRFRTVWRVSNGLCPDRKKLHRRLRETARCIRLDPDGVSEHEIAGLGKILVGMDDEAHPLLDHSFVLIDDLGKGNGLKA